MSSNEKNDGKVETFRSLFQDAVQRIFERTTVAASETSKSSDGATAATADDDGSRRNNRCIILSGGVDTCAILAATKVKPFDAVPPEEHQNFHTDSEADNPHSFLYTPIWRDVQDPESGIVAYSIQVLSNDDEIRTLK